MIKLDGNEGEGGGQILRTALALSCITKKPFDIVNIRKNRPDPGLKAQHLNCIKTLQQLYSCKVEDSFLGSEKLRFIPGELKKRKIEIDIGTAGSITLLLQCVVLPCVLEKKSIKIKIIGGTDVKWSMQWDYYNEVVLSQYRRFADIETRLIRRGYYPKGNGEIEIKIVPKENKEKIDLSKRGSLIYIKGISHASKDLGDVAERQASAAEQSLSQLNCPIRIDTRYYNSKSIGSGISLWVTFSLNEEDIDMVRPIRLGSDALGEKGKSSEEVGEEAGKKLVDEINSGAIVDNHLCDNILPLLGLFGGEIKTSKITKHTLSNIYVCENFLGKIFQVEENVIKVQQSR